MESCQNYVWFVRNQHKTEFEPLNLLIMGMGQLTLMHILDNPFKQAEDSSARALTALKGDWTLYFPAIVLNFSKAT